MKSHYSNNFAHTYVLGWIRFRVPRRRRIGIDDLFFEDQPPCRGSFKRFIRSRNAPSNGRRFGRREAVLSISRWRTPRKEGRKSPNGSKEQWLATSSWKRIARRVNRVFLLIRQHQLFLLIRQHQLFLSIFFLLLPRTRMLNFLWNGFAISPLL